MTFHFPSSIFVFSGLLYSATTGFLNNPGTVTIHENQDSSYVVWPAISARCLESTTCVTQCPCNGLFSCIGSIFSGQGITYTCTQPCYPETTCDTCSLSSNPSNLFTISGLQVSKIACSDAGCGPLCSASGCVNAGESFPVGVECHHSSYSAATITTTFTVSITQNAAPTFTFRDGASVSVDQSRPIGFVINKMLASDTDTNIDGITTIYYSLDSGPASSWIHGNTLFALDISDGEIYVTRDLSLEFSWTYTMTLCVHDRREDETCNDLTITLNGCFETPTCSDQSDLTIQDTHGTYSGHGTTNKLFDMDIPDPSDHFPDFNTGWHDLDWTLHSSDLDIAAVNLDTGEVYITSNFSIWPAYPTKDYSIVVNVANSESCYETQCTMTIRVTYTNWPIEIRSLVAPDNEKLVPEDTDDKILLHSLVVYDYNYASEDNVTCFILSISPTVSNLFVLEHNDSGSESNAWNSWNLYKSECQDRNCGYKADSFLCALNIGCLNHNLTSSYTVTIKCQDAYGSTVQDTFTMNVDKNVVPVWTNLPMNITLDSDKLASLDTIFSMTYTDDESETLYYEYTYGPTDHGWFLGTTSGNYFNNLGNISMTMHQWNLTGNNTYTAHICGHERRNEICEYLTIFINENCGEAPDCTGTSVAVDETYAVGGTLFTVSSLVNAPVSGVAFTGLSYSMAASDSSYFSMDSSGDITTIKTLAASYPTTTYFINAFVYDTHACQYGHCALTVTVTPVNYDIAITNFPATVSIHEDTAAETTLFVIITLDPNSDDTVFCNITSVTPTPVAVPDLFFLRETYSGSDAYVIMSRENPGLTSATTQYTVSIKCFDSQLTFDTGDLTVDVDLNVAPTLNNLDGSVTVDPATVLNGTTIFTASVTDTENDAITYTCTVASTMVPLQCVSGTGIIQLRRDVNIVTENNVAYTIDLCIGDAKHPNAVCGTLTVTFTSTRTHPVLGNLPDSVTFAEDTAVGSNLFHVSVTDPDVGDTHTIYMHSVLPESASGQFALDRSTGVLTSLLAFDYEGGTTLYNITFSLHDQHLSALEKKTLNIGITNVNEQPSISTGTMAITFTETTVIGTVLEGPNFNCTDPDGSTDTLTYAITSGTHAASFTMNDATGVISLAATWDLEGGSLPSSTAILFTCSDVAGLSATAAITIAITDVNEFAPDVVVVYSTGLNNISLYGNTTVLEDLVTVTASDQDNDDDCQFTYTLLGDGHGVQYFTMDTRTIGSGGATCTSVGALRLIQKISLGYDLDFYITIKVSDGETDELFTGVNVYLHYYASDPEISGPYSECLLCTTNGKMFVSFLCVEAAFIVIALLHICVHFYCRTSKHKAQTDPITEFKLRKKNKTPNDHKDDSDEESVNDDDDDNDLKNVPSIQALRSTVRNEPARTAFSPGFIPWSKNKIPDEPARTAFSPQNMQHHLREMRNYLQKRTSYVRSPLSPSDIYSSGPPSRISAVTPSDISVQSPVSLPGTSLDF